MESWTRLSRALLNIKTEMCIVGWLKIGYQKVKGLLVTKMEVLLKDCSNKDNLLS